MLKQFEEASIKTVVNIEGGPAGLCDVHEVSQSYLDFTPTISLSPNASLTSESEMWQEKLREVISERESLETSHKIELKELKEENNALKEKLSSINTCMEEKGLQIEKLIESNLYKDSVIASHQKTIDDSEGKCNVRKHDENCIEIQELKIQLDAAISEKTLCIQSCTDLRNEVDQWKHSFECLQDDFEFMKVNLAEEKNKLQEENESLKLLLESERLQSSSLLLEKESQMNEIDVLKKQYENLKLENAANLTAYDSLNMDFSKKVNEAEKVRQDLSEMKIYVENFMTEKAQHDYDYIKLKHEFEEKCQTVEEIQQKLTLFFNQLHTVVQQNEDFQDCHSVGLIQSDNLDISSKLHEVLDMCVNLRSENEKLRQLFNDDFSSTDCSKCLTLDSGVTEKLQLKNELQYSDDVTDWKTRYDNLLQEKLQLEVELQSVQSETGISNLDIVDCRIGGGKLHTIEEESESVMNNLQDVSVENVSLLVYNEGYTKDEDLSSNINLEINELKNENNELQQVIIKQHSELEDICNILQQEKDSKLVIEEKNKELLADMLSIRQELENLNYKLKDEESSKIVLDSALKELQKVCATYEVEKDNLEKNVIVLKSKLEMEQLDHQIAIQEICTLKEKLDQSLFEDDIETLRKKLERAVTKKEADDITVLSAYLLGSGDPVVCQQNEISESETLNNCLVEDPLKRNECMMVNLAEERQQFVDESSENFMASHSIVEENQQPTHPDVKSGNHQLQVSYLYFL